MGAGRARRYDRRMNVGVDASNIRAGGGITHLRALLEQADPARHGIARVVVWAGGPTLAALPERPWLDKVAQPLLERPLPLRVFWQQALLPRLLRETGCSVLFAPGGTLPLTLPWRGALPGVVLSQNILPFEPLEAARYGRVSAARLKLRLLRVAQARALAQARRAAFLTAYARGRVLSAVPAAPAEVRIIPHGADPRFLAAPRPQEPPERFGARPFRFLYTSTVDVYKHQSVVARAAARLRAAGLPVAVDFVGGGRAKLVARLRAELRALDPAGASLRLAGPIEHERLPALYRAADAFVFASTCENMPIVLIEAMASGLPIACSRRGPMPEVLGEGGLYFDPESEADCAAAMETLFASAPLRARLAAEAFARARRLSWARCADETLALIREAA